MTNSLSHTVYRTDSGVRDARDVEYKLTLAANALKNVDRRKYSSLSRNIPIVAKLDQLPCAIGINMPTF